MRGKRGFGASRSVEQTLIRDTRKPVFNLGQIAARYLEKFSIVWKPCRHRTTPSAVYAPKRCRSVLLSLTTRGHTRSAPRDQPAFLFPGFFFELPKNMASPMEAIARTVMSINSIIISPPGMPTSGSAPRLNTGTAGVEIRHRVVSRHYLGCELKPGCSY